MKSMEVWTGVNVLSKLKKTSGAAAAIFAGISAAILSFMIPISLIIAVFGQLRDRQTADALMLPAMILAVAISAIIDLHFYLKYPAKTAFPISYYSVCLMLCALSFYYSSGFDFTPLYGTYANVASELFRSFSLRSCAVTAFSLLIRIGAEFAAYIKSTRI